MYNHRPQDYDCPFCRVAAGNDYGTIETRPEDVVLRTEQATAFISSRWWPRNEGHVLVIPNTHYENIYDLPLEDATAIHAVARQIALALKQIYQCDGVSTRQHNEPAGNQDVWHYHVHVFPRYHGDQLYTSQYRRTTPEERTVYAARLRAYF